MKLYEIKFIKQKGGDSSENTDEEAAKSNGEEFSEAEGALHMSET